MSNNKIIERIQAIASTEPDRIAYDNGHEVLTYLELDRYSDAIASHLKGIYPNKSGIVVYGGQEKEMIISFLSCTKAGHYYIPVDSHTPKERVQMIVEESQAAGVISIAEWPFTSKEMIDLKLLRSIMLEEQPKLSDCYVTGDDVYYTIFTSGTTGKPKGVQITYNNLISFTDWMLSDFELKEGQRFLSQAPFSFDLSVMDLYPALLSKGTLVPMEKETVDNFSLLFKALPDMTLNVWVSTPSLVEICLLNPEFSSEYLPTLENFQFCGEELPRLVAMKLLERFPKAAIYNTYGPTEATVAITNVKITKDILDTYDRLPLGKVKSDTALVIKTDEEQEASDEPVGEIIIVGPGVSIGYYNNPEKTQEAFTTIDGKPAYKTGDAGLVKDGYLFYKGRLDFQIKWHGYRIELGDIDHHLSMIPGVRNACVVPKYNKYHKVQQLIAYVVWEQEEMTAQDLSKKLKAELTKSVMDYMVPQRFKFVETLPLSANGKVDRKALISEVNS